ncbi:MAG: hypothetical protein ABF593_04570 [Acetobacter papayae]|uniref:hypothetical protein n=1 Tax=Acetobacter papayae TaxID=1076592 RepID=UPI0039EB1921
MKSTDDRKLFGTLIGASAATGNIATIPATQGTAGDGTASIALAFPPETFIARAAGGEPPRGADMNGFLNLLSSAMQVLQAGYLGPFDATFAAGIGGYPAGAIVSGSTAGTFWVSTADANTTVPGATGATWQSLFNGYATEAWANGLFATIAQLQAEASTRASADTQLQANITSEASARASADTALQANITQETTARVAADALNAKLAGGNSLAGDQDVNGSVVATGGHLLATQSSDATMRAVLYASSAVAQFALQSISGSTSTTLGYLNISSAGALSTSLGTVALTSQLPTSGTITSGTYTKTPMNDGTGRSVLTQCFSVSVTDKSVITFPMTLSAAPSHVNFEVNQNVDCDHSYTDASESSLIIHLWSAGTIQINVMVTGVVS